MSFRYGLRQWSKEVDKHLREIGGDIDVSKLPEEWAGLPSVGDLSPSLTEYGEYLKVRDIEGSPVRIVKIEDWSGVGDPSMKSGPSLLVNADLIGGEKGWFIVSHQVLYRKLDALRQSVPFLATFYKVDKKRYFDVK